MRDRRTSVDEQPGRCSTAPARSGLPAPSPAKARHGSTGAMGRQQKDLLEGEGSYRAVTGDCEISWGGGYRRLEMQFGRVLGGWDCLWGRVRAGVSGGSPP
eukprot:CAMPEP_0174382920 /NCGR_PEP_ID=MMETSP0811_2-20130205/124893_1 /TAXON_ID=73025 ORGANISM="Eutreptiella gymnastica-like, Strain CCMP1594" /NCGR_SAMPLE_ID=MMETSP0811_2 /ASSEMBLY_ACC=CAM_ASM_000667 /LENGTH=100 /DNA_ID=CAMNT_0015536339 /DNA_START=814 /DNA_END=1113 /DNA_ORIENTATION=+